MSSFKSVFKVSILQGLDLATLARDHQLLSWLGANSYRTSHYPYAEEDLMMADREGLLVIAECAAVSLDGFSSELLGGGHLHLVRL